MLEDSFWKNYDVTLTENRRATKGSTLFRLGFLRVGSAWGEGGGGAEKCRGL